VEGGREGGGAETAGGRVCFNHDQSSSGSVMEEEGGEEEEAAAAAAPVKSFTLPPPPPPPSPPCCKINAFAAPLANVNSSYPGDTARPPSLLPSLPPPISPRRLSMALARRDWILWATRSN